MNEEVVALVLTLPQFCPWRQILGSPTRTTVNQNLNLNSKLNLSPKALGAKLGSYVADQPHSEPMLGPHDEQFQSEACKRKWQTPQNISSASLNKV